MHPLLDQLRAQHERNFGWSLSCCGWQRELAEDVLQEAYLRVLDGRARYAGRAAASTWFYAVIRRVALETQRSQSRRRALNLRLAREEDRDGGAPGRVEPDPAELDEMAATLRAALLELSERQREVLHLVFYAELTLEQAADILEISVGSARTHYHRGKLRLAEVLQLDQEDDD